MFGVIASSKYLAEVSQSLAFKPIAKMGTLPLHPLAQSPIDTGETLKPREQTAIQRPFSPEVV